MTGRGVRVRFVRAVAALAIGGTAFQLSSCTPEVRQVVLDGLQTASLGLATTAVTAYFTSLQDDTTGGTSLTTTTGTTTP
jgi:hypothetical protein